MAARDPVCRMVVDESTAKWVSLHGERAFYFCSAGCKRIFDVNPEKYVNK